MSDDSTRDDHRSPSVSEANKEPAKPSPEAAHAEPPADAWTASGDSLIDEPADEDPADRAPPDDDPAADDLPFEYILEAFKKQCTPEMFDEAVEIARSYVRFIRSYDLPTWPHHAEGLVNGILGGICVRDVRWHPDRLSLLQRFANVLRQQSWNEVRRKVRYGHVAIEYDSEEVDRIIGHADLSRVPEEVVAKLLTHVVDELEAIAPNNQNVRAVLGCWRDLVTTQEAIAASTGLTAAECKAVRQQIMRLVAKLDPNVGEIARGLLRNT